MIDIHSHILPEVDDGSASVEMSCKMLELLRAQGVTVFTATPHFYAWNDTPEAFLQRRQAGYDRLVRAGVDTASLVLGAEVTYYDGMGKSQALTQLQLGRSGMLLVEMPFSNWTERMVREVCDLPVQLGLQPVLAHIERYDGKQQFPKYRDTLMQNGVYFQCNAAAFLDGWKSRPYLQMLRRGEVHFIGSDCHNLTSRAPELGKAAAVIAKKCGPELLPALQERAMELLFPENL